MIPYAGNNNMSTHPVSKNAMHAKCIEPISHNNIIQCEYVGASCLRVVTAIKESVSNTCYSNVMTKNVACVQVTSVLSF